jgi:hypothetical protein
MFVFASVGDDTGAVETVGPADVLYVDNVLGDDATASRGDYARPFFTVQAALDAALTDDVVQLAPQSFAIAAALTVPTATTRITLQGWGDGNAVTVTAPAGMTTLVGATGVNVIDLGANLGLTRASIRNLTIDFLNGNGIHADGSLYAANGYLTGTLWLENLEFVQRGTGFAINEKYVRSCRMVNCYGVQSTGGALSFVSCSGIEFDHCQFPASACLISYDPTDPLRTTTQNLTRMRATTIGGVGSDRGITLTGTPRLEGDSACRTGFLFGLNLTSSGATVPSCTWYGQVGTSGTLVAFNFSSATREIPDSATAMTWDFRGCKFFGSALFKVAGAAANSQTVRMDGSEAYNLATTITADANIALRGTGAVWPTAAITTPAGTGSVAPPSAYALGATAAAAPTTTVTIGFRLPSTTYTVLVEADNATSLPTATTAKTTTTFDIAVTVAAGNITPVLFYRA